MFGGRSAVRGLFTAIVGASLCVWVPAAYAVEGGSISGRVTSAATGEPLEGVEPCAVKVVPVPSFPGTCTLTNANGEYTIPSLEAGEYTVMFISYESRYDGQYYNHKDGYSEAEPVTVATAHTTAGIDGVLPEVGGNPNSELQGTVTDASSKAPIEGIEVCAYQYASEQPEVEHCTTSGAGGEYALSNLPTGEYTVEFADPPESKLNYVTRYYGGASEFPNATRVYLPPVTTKYRIDGELNVGGWISGLVGNAATGGPAESVLVCASASDSEIGECALTDASGAYTIDALASGEYVVAFIGEPGGYLMQYYDGAYAASEAEQVSVIAEQTTASIDASLWPGVFKAPVLLAPPSVSGSAVAGGTLSCSSGSWSANPPASFAYRWLLDGTPLPSATQSSYVTAAGDVGHSVSCEVQASNRAVGKKGLARGLSSPTLVAIPLLPPPLAAGAPKQAMSPLVLLDTRRIVPSRAGSIRVRLGCEHASCTGTLRLLVQATAGHGKGRQRGGDMSVLAKVPFALAENRSGLVALRLTGPESRRLQYARVHRLRVALQALPHGGESVTKTVGVL
jgi:hypothetical protein